MAKEKLFQVGVKALITDASSNILLLDSGDWHLKNQKRHWDIPGGRIKEGHSILDTLKREVAEEIGITGIISPKLFTAVIANFPGLLLLIYKTKIPQNGKITLSEEHTGFEWVSSKEAAKRLAYKYPREFTKLLG